MRRLTLLYPLNLIAALLFGVIFFATAEGGWDWNAGWGAVTGLFGGFSSLLGLLGAITLGLTFVGLAVYGFTHPYSNGEQTKMWIHLVILIALFFATGFAGWSWVELPDNGAWFFIGFMGLVGLQTAAARLVLGRPAPTTTTPTTT